MMSRPTTTPTPIRPAALKEAEAAAYIAHSPRRLAQLRAEGKVGFVRNGAAVVYPICALEKFLAESTVVEGGGR